MSGWIKLHRSLCSSAVGAHPEYLAVWIHLLLMASHKPTERLVGRQVVKLEPGQLVFGRHAFSQKTGVSEAVIRGALKALEALQQITIKSTTKYSVISILKWDLYQGESPANVQQKTSSEPSDDHKQECKEVKKEASRNQQADRVPYEEIFQAYADQLPELPQLRMKDEARKKAILSIWRKNEKFQIVDFWVRYFGYVKQSPFLMGMNAIGFDWLMKPANFKKVLEGNYHNA